jgi:hypothetical protein
MSTTVWIAIVVVAIVVIAGLVAVISAAISRGASQRRLRKAEQIRHRAQQQSAEVDRLETLGREPAARAHAAQAEAEAKSAEAARLQQRAAAHQNQAAEAREDLQTQLQHADRIDPGAETGAKADRGRAVPGGGEDEAVEHAGKLATDQQRTTPPRHEAS